MAEYISREAAIERIEKLLHLQATTARVIIEAIPAADVRPVAHGKWIQDEIAKRLDLYVCSECGQPLQIVDADGWKTTTVYCPNCGADMREKQT